MPQTETKPRTIAHEEETNMSLDRNSRLGRIAADELVPSRYAVQIGDIEVLVISDGVLPLPTKMLGYNADPAERAAWLNDMFLPPDAFDWALNVVVVRSGKQTFTFTVDKMPRFAGVDPYNKRIDRNSEDNLKRVE